ncbi:hypothetical protein S245_053456 [Arachis hypogaea]
MCIFNICEVLIVYVWLLLTGFLIYCHWRASKDQILSPFLVLEKKEGGGGVLLQLAPSVCSCSSFVQSQLQQISRGFFMISCFHRFSYGTMLSVFSELEYIRGRDQGWNGRV